MPTLDFADDPLLALLAVLEQSWLNLEILPHLGRHFHLPCKQVVLKRLPETIVMILLYKYIFTHLLVVAVWDPFIHHENLWSRGLYTTNTMDGIIENVSKSPPPDMQKRCTWFEALGSPLYPPCFLSGWTSDVHHPAWLRTTWLLTNLWSLSYFEMLKPSSIFWSWGR